MRVDHASDTECAYLFGVVARLLLREPLVHFAVLGALVFVTHGALVPDARIAVGRDRRRALAALFTERHGRSPNHAEVGALVESWIEDEVLFREGLALGLSERDSAVRDLIVAQMRRRLQNSVGAGAASPAQLAAYYSEHRAEFAQPELVSFSDYLIHVDPRAEEVARALLQELRLGRPVDYARTELSRRSEAQLTPLYGELARTIFTLEPGGWHELRSARGVHLIRVEKREPARERPFAEVQEELKRAFEESERRRRFHEELAELRARYEIRVEGAAP